LDPDGIGLGELGKKEGYLARQLKTWYRSWTASIEPAKYDDLRAHELYQYFIDQIPEQGMARVVHGDYGFHNCLINAQSTVAAVVDWELASLGDPLADLGYTLNLFLESQTDIDDNPEMSTSLPGFPPRSALATRYAERTGRALDKLDYYRGFNYWKRAAIVHGVYARYMAGQKSTEGVDLDGLIKVIDISLSLAQQAVGRLEN
jgi:aminoglycoside phosphotransferase (APT) family kinase protein